MDYKVFRHFLHKNLDVITNYIKHGVLDRQEIYLEANQTWVDQPWMGMNVKNAIPLNEDSIVNPGYIYIYDGKLYMSISFRLDERNNAANDKGIILWGYRENNQTHGGETPEGKRPLFYLAPLYESQKPGKVNEDDIVYNYTFFGEERVATYHTYTITDRNSQTEVTFSHNFRLDITIDKYDVKKEDVANSIALFFDIIELVSQDKPNEGAKSDMEEAVKLTLGRECSPFRFIPALGHQLIKYILKSFVIEKIKDQFPSSVAYNKYVKPHLNSLRKELESDLGYNKLVQSLFNLAEGCAIASIGQTANTPEKKKKQEKIKERYRAAVEILELIFFHKAFRNKESHSQYKIKNPVQYTNYYLIDHIMLVYALKYLFRFDEISDLKNLHNCIHRQENLTKTQFTENEIADFKKDSKTDYTDLINLCLSELKRIENSKISRDELDKIFQSVENLNEEWDKIKDKYNDETLNYINEYQSCKLELKELEEKQHSLEETIKQCDNKNTEYFKSLYKDLEDTKDKLGLNLKGPSLPESVDKVKKDIKKIKNQQIIISSVITFLALVIIGLGIWLFGPTIPGAEKFDKLYWTSSPLCPDDLPYKRAQHLEHELINKTAKFKSIDEFAESVKSPDLIALRHEMVEAYKDAIHIYESLDDNKDENGERFYRLAQMYFRGNGGIIDLTKALRYAEIAISLGYTDAKGLRSFMSVSNDTHVPNQAHWDNLIDESEGPYKDLVMIFDQIHKIQNTTNHDMANALLTVDSIINCIDTICNRNIEITPEATFIKCAIAGNWIFDVKNNPVKWYSFIDYYHSLLELSISHNYLPAQIEASRIAKKANDFETDALLSNLIFQNGFTHFAAEIYYYWIKFQGVSENTFNEKFPGFSDEVNKSKERFIESYHKASQLYQKGKEALNKSDLSSSSSFFHRAFDKYTEMLSKIPAGIEHRPTEYDHWIQLRGSDSIANILIEQLINSPSKKQLGTFRPHTDSISKKKAWKAYVEAYLKHNNLGGHHNDDVQVKELLTTASELGLDKATYALALADTSNVFYSKLRNDLDNIPNISLCEQKMKSIADSSEMACLWLAEHYRRQNPDLSMYYVNMISDSLSLYKNLRIVGDKLNNRYIYKVNETIREDDIRRLYQAFNFNNDIPDYQKAAFFELSSILEKNQSSISQLCLSDLCLNSNGLSYGLGMGAFALLDSSHETKKDFYFLMLQSSIIPAASKDIAGRFVTKFASDRPLYSYCHIFPNEKRRWEEYSNSTTMIASFDDLKIHWMSNFAPLDKIVNEAYIEGIHAPVALRNSTLINNFNLFDLSL